MIDLRISESTDVVLEAQRAQSGANWGGGVRGCEEACKSSEAGLWQDYCEYDPRRDEETETTARRRSRRQRKESGAGAGAD